MRFSAWFATRGFVDAWQGERAGDGAAADATGECYGAHGARGRVDLDEWRRRRRQPLSGALQFKLLRKTKGRDSLASSADALCHV